ncbi:unnamed protein product [Symbiodinium sp. KB8]|nr:unnamed protein product [Symbiodinium sp. KB8]
MDPAQAAAMNPCAPCAGVQVEAQAPPAGWSQHGFAPPAGWNPPQDPSAAWNGCQYPPQAAQPQPAEQQPPQYQPQTQPQPQPQMQPPPVQPHMQPHMQPQMQQQMQPQMQPHMQPQQYPPYPQPQYPPPQHYQQPQYPPQYPAYPQHPQPGQPVAPGPVPAYPQWPGQAPAAAPAPNGSGWPCQSSQGRSMSIAEACVEAASGSAGETVQDTDVRVIDYDERPLPLHKFWSFDQCAQFFPQKLIDELKKSFPAPSQIQAFTWPLALYGKDVIGIAATGSGKTLAFLLPAFSDFHKSGLQPQRDGVGLVVMSPTRELAQQIEVEANRFGKCLGMWTVAMYGGAPKWDQQKKYQQGVHAIIACPGRLNDFIEGRQVQVNRVRKLVLDEADRMLDMGFEPQIQKILQHIPRNRHTMFFTATWPREVRQLAATMMGQPAKVMIGNRDELKANQDVTQQVRLVESSQKKAAVLELLQEAGLMDKGAIGKCLIFASTKRMCEELSRQLYACNVACSAIHGDKDQRERDMALNGLKQGRLRALVATDVAARGLDIKGVGLVVNYDAANNSEDYIHRIGRTGRAGKKGYAITLLSSEDRGKASGIIQAMESTNQHISDELRSFARQGGGGGRPYRGGGGKGSSKGSCKWCAKGECWTHGDKKSGRNRSRSPRRR